MPLDQVQPGDIIYYGNFGPHVALYIGGGSIIHARHPGPGGEVQQDSMYGYDRPVGRHAAGLGPLLPLLGSLSACSLRVPPPPISPSLERLRARDEAAFMELVERLTPSMRRVARMFVSTDAVADEVVQEAWVGVLRGHRRVRGALVAADLDLPDPREHRQDARATRGPQRPVRDARRRRPRRADLGSDGLRHATGHWSSLPFDWRGLPEDRLTGRETLAVIGRAIEALPPMQAEVIRLRDVARLVLRGGP